MWSGAVRRLVERRFLLARSSWYRLGSSLAALRPFLAFVPDADGCGRSFGRRRARRSQIDAADGGQSFRGLAQIAVLHAAHEIEDVALGAAAEAVEALLFRRDLQRRLGVVVEGAEQGELRAAAASCFEVVVAEHLLEVGVLL